MFESYDNPEKVERKLKKFFKYMQSFFQNCSDNNVVIFWKTKNLILNNEIMTAFNLDNCVTRFHGSIHAHDDEYYEFEIISNVEDLLLKTKSKQFFKTYVTENFYLFKKMNHESGEHDRTLNNLMEMTLSKSQVNIEYNDETN